MISKGLYVSAKEFALYPVDNSFIHISKWSDWHFKMTAKQMKNSSRGK